MKAMNKSRPRVFFYNIIWNKITKCDQNWLQSCLEWRRFNTYLNCMYLYRISSICEHRYKEPLLKTNLETRIFFIKLPILHKIRENTGLWCSMQNLLGKKVVTTTLLWFIITFYLREFYLLGIHVLVMLPLMW